MASHHRAWAALGAAGVLSLTGSALACDVGAAICAQASALMDRVAHTAEAWVDQTLAAARADVERTHGLFVYTPGVGDSFGGDWSGVSMLTRAEDVVLLVHGLDEPGTVWCDLAPALFDAGHTVVRFDYPNDQAIVTSGAMLFDAMAKLSDAGVQRVRIVGHSMGGLVSREMLTRDGEYGGAPIVDGHPRVESLIVVGTPFEGSDFAPLEWFGEARDQIVRCIDQGGDPRALLGFLYDGRGQAADDLTPGSEYLQGACGRRMSTEVRMTSIIGQALPVNSDTVAQALDGSWAAWLIGKDNVDSLERFADRAAAAVGDGVVTASSACLTGDSAEVIVVQANHRSLLCRSELLDGLASKLGMTVGDPPSIALILDRVASKP